MKDFWFTVLAVAFVVAIFGGFTFAVYSAFESSASIRATADCSYFADWGMESIPARCLSYFGVGR